MLLAHRDALGRPDRLHEEGQTVGSALLFVGPLSCHIFPPPQLHRKHKLKPRGEKLILSQEIVTQANEGKS